MKLCKDCRYYSKDMCLTFSKRFRSGGDIKIISLPCDSMREAYSFCGPEAKLFEPKKKWWRIWK